MDFTFKGRRVQRSIKVANRREAQDIEKVAWTQLARGEVGIADKPTPSRKTIGILLDAVKDDFQTRGKLSAKTRTLLRVFAKRSATSMPTLSRQRQSETTS
jgi:hypothetical protein